MPPPSRPLALRLVHAHERRRGRGCVDLQGAESGFRILRRDLLALTAVTWVFFFLYGPVEVALPVYVAHDLAGSAQLLAAYWTAFGVGALAADLLTGALRAGHIRRLTLLIVAGWGLCLIPFAVRRSPSQSFSSDLAA